MNVYYVIEMQTNDGSGSAIVNTYTDLQLAYQKYYQIMSAAAVSEIPTHAAIILSGDLFKVAGAVAPRS